MLRHLQTSCSDNPNGSVSHLIHDRDYSRWYCNITVDCDSCRAIHLLGCELHKGRGVEVSDLSTLTAVPKRACLTRPSTGTQMCGVEQGHGHTGTGKQHEVAGAI